MQEEGGGLKSSALIITPSVNKKQATFREPAYIQKHEQRIFKNMISYTKFTSNITKGQNKVMKGSKKVKNKVKTRNSYWNIIYP